MKNVNIGINNPYSCEGKVKSPSYRLYELCLYLRTNVIKSQVYLSNFLHPTTRIQNAVRSFPLSQTVLSYAIAFLFITAICLAGGESLNWHVFVFTKILALGMIAIVVYLVRLLEYENDEELE